ncbi:MAG: nucleotide-binding protein [Cyclobacteriaceae bacterium]
MAKRRQVKTEADEPTILTIPKKEFDEKLEARIVLGKEIHAKEIKTEKELEENEGEFWNWNDYNLELLKKSFTKEYNEYRKSYDDSGSWIGVDRVLRGGGTTPQQKLIDFKEKVESKIDNLQKLRSKIELLKTSEKESNLVIQELNKEESSNLKVFIVHGHNDTVKLEVARTVEKLGLKPVILHEQANQGQTIIEKFEKNSNVGFAIALLTCDDLGKPKTSEKEHYRARQNVILELGFFIGRLGRNRVFPLYESGVELPSDLSGVVYNLLDDAGRWKFDLVRELKEAGYPVDANKILGA